MGISSQGKFMASLATSCVGIQKIDLDEEKEEDEEEEEPVAAIPCP